MSVASSTVASSTGNSRVSYRDALVATVQSKRLLAKRTAETIDPAFVEVAAKPRKPKSAKKKVSVVPPPTSTKRARKSKAAPLHALSDPPDTFSGNGVVDACSPQGHDKNDNFNLYVEAEQEDVDVDSLTNDDEDDADMGAGGRMHESYDQEEILQLAQDISIAAAEELQARRNPTFQHITVGTAEAAMTGAVFVLIERGDDEEITLRQVFQVQEPVALDGTPGLAFCIATNDEDTYTGTATDEHLVITLPLESHHRFAWLAKVGFDRVLQHGTGFRAIWEAMRRPYQPYGRRDARALKPLKRLLTDPLDDGEEFNLGGASYAPRRTVVTCLDDEEQEYPDLPAHLTDAAPARKRPLQCKGKSGYGEAKEHMYTVPDGLLRAPISSATAGMDAAQGKRNATASKTIIQKLGSGNLPDQLQIISAGETRDILSEDIAEATIRMLKWKAVPIDPFIMEQLLKSWHVPDGSEGLKWFVSLNTVLGTMECGALVERYRHLTKGYTGEAVGRHSAEFLAQFAKGAEATYLDGHISRVGEAMIKMVAAITVLFSMKYCYQHVMFRSVATLVQYFRVRNFGQQSEVMLPFMKACVAAMFTEWEDFRQEICDQRRTDPQLAKARLLARGRAIPFLGKNGSIETLYNHFYHVNNGKGFAAALLFNYSAGNEVSKKEGDGKKTRKKKANAQPGGAVGAAPLNPATPTPKVRYCRGYNSSGGCDKSPAACSYQHANPPKNSTGAQHLAKYFKENPSVVASQNFSKYSV